MLIYANYKTGRFKLSLLVFKLIFLVCIHAMFTFRYTWRIYIHLQCVAQSVVFTTRSNYEFWLICSPSLRVKVLHSFSFFIPSPALRSPDCHHSALCSVFPIAGSSRGLRIPCRHSNAAADNIAVVCVFIPWAKSQKRDELRAEVAATETRAADSEVELLVWRLKRIRKQSRWSLSAPACLCFYLDCWNSCTLNLHFYYILSSSTGSISPSDESPHLQMTKQRGDEPSPRFPMNL